MFSLVLILGAELYTRYKKMGSGGSKAKATTVAKKISATPAREKTQVSTNPCSGRYEGGDGVAVVLMIDIDQISEYSKSLGFVSGTITKTKGGLAPWKEDASSLYFKIIPATAEIFDTKLRHEIKGIAKLFFSDGTRYGGAISVKVHFDGKWIADLDIKSENGNMSFRNLERKSKFFKNVGLDIHFTEKVTWPTMEVKNVTNPPADMLNRKIDAFQAFEDAGIKLVYDDSRSEKITDSTPKTPWTKADMYEAMMAYYDKGGKGDDIWCMMGTTPPDKRHAGFSFDKDGRRGFGIFGGHPIFAGLHLPNERQRADASRRLLHNFIRGCGHCLGLKHPIEIGEPGSLSWMNYAWRYDVGREIGNFYRNFRFTFSDQELIILRHSPEKEFCSECDLSYLSELHGYGYKATSVAPQDDEESNDKNSKSLRKVGLELKVRSEYLKGQLLTFEAILRNKGKLPAVIERDLSLESGYLQVYVTKPDGSSVAAVPFARPVHSGHNKPHVLCTSADDQGPDYYSDLVIVGRGSHGSQIDQPGKYGIRAVYSGGRYSVSSATYTFDVIAEESEIEDEVLTAATLQTSNYSRYPDAFHYLKRFEGQPMAQKKGKLGTVVALLEGLAHEGGRELEVQKAKFVRAKDVVDKKQILKDTREIVEHYHEEGTSGDNLEYANVVLSRGKVYVSVSMTADGDSEFNKMINDLTARGEKNDVILSLTKKWNKVKNPVPVAAKQTAESLQKRVSEVLNWNPSTRAHGESDLSGLGLEHPFGTFDDDHKTKAANIVRMLFTKYEETKDLKKTINYAAKLQRGREVNNMVLKWALEVFIVHSSEAKKAGIRYPEPELLQPQSLAASASISRRGQPTDEWMNYWRCDADLNFHHKHWHVVYRVKDWFDKYGSLPIGTGEKSHWERQGELFGYMHEQMLARYDAERESWGLLPVTEFEYRQMVTGFYAGTEFHEAPQFKDVVRRPKQTWDSDTVKKFLRHEKAYYDAVAIGSVAPGVAMTPNWSGHVIEHSSAIYKCLYGNIHNSGHNQFGFELIKQPDQPDVPEDKKVKISSYMWDTATAIRDPVFFRWHKRVDNLWQAENEHYQSDLALNPPPITITADDIVLSTDRNPPAGFADWKNGEWCGSAPSEEAVLKTFLGPPMKKYELDNKLSHEKFYYHLRLKRNPGTSSSKDVPVTIRIFICPKKRQTERKRWIEMDKFACNIKSGSDHVVLTRADVFSSVIKRQSKDLNRGEPDSENHLVITSQGFCECGWPYTMLLPRGTSKGEEYVICVIATDNNVDKIGIRTTCGSMSYCGASDKQYPDARHMGYPFCNPITHDKHSVSIPKVFDLISNAAYKSFKIINNVVETPLSSAIDIWWPYTQLKVNDGGWNDEDGKAKITDYLPAPSGGTCRVLVDKDAAKPSQGPRILVRFEGRGIGGGDYVIRDVYLAQRRTNTLDIVPGTSSRVSAGRQTSFTVPEYGLCSDPFDYRFDPTKGDYFLTFTMEKGGVYLPSSQTWLTSTYFLPPNVGGSDLSGDWTEFGGVFLQLPSIYCAAGIMSET